MRFISPLARAAIWLAVLLSPVGAPLVGAMIGLCPADGSVQPDGPFALSLSYCGVSRPIEHFYQKTFQLPFLPMFFAGPVLGAPLTIAWWLAAFASAAGCVWNLWEALVSRQSETGDL
jgi:hypothetical protein